MSFHSPRLRKILFVSSLLLTNYSQAAFVCHPKDFIQFLKNWKKRFSKKLHFDQPKKEINELVKGVAKPHVYKSPAQAVEALLTGKTDKIIFRSEWSGEFDGISGLFNSHVFTKSQLESWCHFHKIPLDNFDLIANQLTAELKSQDIQRVETSLKRIEFNYGENLESKIKDFNDAKNNLSYSAWDFVEGTNITVTQDPAIPDRYHFVYQAGSYSNHFITDSAGNIIQKNVYDESKSKEYGEDHVIKSLPGMIHMYSQVKTQSPFDPQEAPIIECQLTSDGTPYFLQYHKNRRIQEPTFKLKDRAPGDKMVKASWVRGTTPKEGVVVDVPLFSGSPLEFSLSQNEQRTLNNRAQEFGLGTQMSMDHNDYRLRATLNTDPQGVFVDLNSRSGASEFSHTGITRFFKPELSLNIDAKNLISKELYSKLFDYWYDSGIGKNPTLKLRVISDGETAYVEYLGNSAGLAE